jgi:hypothetical protein
MKELSADDKDYWWAQSSDEDRKRYAKKFLDILDLPHERLPVIERECSAMRQTAVERLSWCRHLQLLQELGHTEHHSTNYARDPELYCHCKRHEHN